MTSPGEDRTLLTGAERTALVRAALHLRRPTPLSVHVERVQARPDGVSVGYQVDAPVGRCYLMASTVPAALATAPVVVTTNTHELRVAVWSHPGDPQLPGLAEACDLERVRAWLPEARGLELMTYRALRRAVIKVTGRQGPLAYLKVVRPAAAPALALRHRGFPGAPRVLGSPAPGVLALEPLAGGTLAAWVAAGGAPVPLARLIGAPVPGAAAIPRVPPVSERLSEHVRMIEPRVVGTQRRHLLDLSRDLHGALAASAAPRPVVLTHGDLHGDNVIVDAAGRPCGVLDVDRCGPGFLLDDVACLLAHTEVSAAMNDGAARDHLAAAAQAWWRQAMHPALRRHTDPAALAARTAASILALAGVCPDGTVPSVLDLADAYLRRGHQRKDAS
ncbi:aminoglycoside phosphotransferase family protein [Serinibacter salmoneus]|uniref:Aminoglycoside phosphotransferase domain-containing protein n=1 Tax=Serinibacter salmoneus TaxID=556530 RepID=A0A2A9CXN4_9MICO|nr:aminoglycoside phosphotransferase family protein [Serinibacter salmoneus]PFG18911.1 hypothetical protein ATL40_0464 [Serinibacter salmoneus]